MVWNFKFTLKNYLENLNDTENLCQDINKTNLFKIQKLRTWSMSEKKTLWLYSIQDRIQDYFENKSWICWNSIHPRNVDGNIIMSSINYFSKEQLGQSRTQIWLGFSLHKRLGWVSENKIDHANPVPVS